MPEVAQLRRWHLRGGADDHWIRRVRMVRRGRAGILRSDRRVLSSVRHLICGGLGLDQLLAKLP